MGGQQAQAKTIEAYIEVRQYRLGSDGVWVALLLIMLDQYPRSFGVFSRLERQAIDIISSWPNRF